MSAAVAMTLAIAWALSPMTADATEGTEGARALGHRLPTDTRAAEAVPPEGFDLRYAREVQRLADLVFHASVRVEALHTPPPPEDPRHPRLEDGAGVVVAPGRILTTARYLEGAQAVRIVRRDGRPVAAEIVRLDPEENLALLAFAASEVPRVRSFPGFGALPEPEAGAAAAEVVVPTSLVGVAPAVQIAALLVDEVDGTLFLSGQVANGLPVFDRHGRLVALADRPTPDRTRSVALPAAPAATWLAPAEGGRREEKGPREQSPRGPGP